MNTTDYRASVLGKTPEFPTDNEYDLRRLAFGAKTIQYIAAEADAYIGYLERRSAYWERIATARIATEEQAKLEKEAKELAETVLNSQEKSNV